MTHIAYIIDGIPYIRRVYYGILSMLILKAISPCASGLATLDWPDHEVESYTIDNRLCSEDTTFVIIFGQVLLSFFVKS